MIGLDDFVKEKYQRCGTDVKSPGDVCGQGLTNEAAEQLGLVPGTAVGTSIIDAHAGVLGCVGCIAEDEHFTVPDITSRMTMICGTSTCHMIMSQEAIFVPGVWGPYYSPILPGLWSAEGGQTAAGKLIDFIVETHPAYGKLKGTASDRKVHIHEVLEERLIQLTNEHKVSSMSQLTKHLHIWPDFHGNRSPLSDPSLKGMVSGLTLSSDMDDLAVKYLATVQALAYGTRNIFDELVKRGHTIELIYICGGLSKNHVYVKTHVDVTGIPAILPNEKESVLLGAAMLGAKCFSNFANVQDAVKQMGGKGKLIKSDLQERQFHDKKYQVFLGMVQHQREYTAIMDG
ncbi:FGGY carbohydrate kinase domain-containing protein [Mytilus edulis]|uniref:FGGY carbohydrate kinase domain-containing protein n=1 Tax=Mytilus edulis TaxID=6550 RepID=A0A8S3VET1_MYTED|nr:FGGY carbohydrate kinase domain-containing protein [Mytilus edulis]